MNSATQYSKLDLQSKCRVCLIEDGKVLIFTVYGKSKTNIKEIFEAYTGVKIDEEDDLPKSLCHDCFSALISTYTFISKCRTTDTVLHTLENIWSSKKSDDCIVIVSAQQNSTEILSKNNLAKYLKSSKKNVYGSKINITNVSPNTITDTENATEIKNEVDDDIDITYINSKQEEDIVDELSDLDVNSTDILKKEIELYNIEDKIEIIVDDNDQTQIPTKSIFNYSDEEVANDTIHLPPQSTIENNVKNEVEKNSLAFKNKICHLCSKSFKHNRSLKQHINTHLKQYCCYICERKFSIRSNLTRHMVVHTGEKPYSCDVCGKGFTQSNTLKQHKERHFSNSCGRPEQKLCSYCGLILDSKKKYLNHLLDIHGDIELSEEDKKICPYSCEMCNRRFQYKGTFDMHMDTHKGIKNYLCNYCGQTFYTRGALHVHLIIHTGERLYKCDFCEKAFLRRTSYITHKRIHTGERPYKCEYCDKAFVQRTSYISHKRIHTGVRPFQCKICSASFKQSSQLGYHMLTHTGQKHHLCSYCGKKFALKGNLRQHMTVHTNETPHICSYCDKGFVSANKMRKHQKIHFKYKQ